MSKNGLQYGLVGLLVALVAGLTFWSERPEVMAQTASVVTGKNFRVNVTRCDGEEFTDVYCFTSSRMVVQNLECSDGPLLAIGPIFAGAVSSVLFLGAETPGRIQGLALAGTCLSRFQGAQIRSCPCSLPTTEGEPGPPEEEQGTHPYLP